MSAIFNANQTNPYMNENNIDFAVGFNKRMGELYAEAIFKSMQEEVKKREFTYDFQAGRYGFDEDGELTKYW